MDLPNYLADVCTDKNDAVTVLTEDLAITAIDTLDSEFDFLGHRIRSLTCLRPALE